MHIMSILCSSADAISSGSCPILFKVVTLNVAICSVCLHFSSFDCLSSVGLQPQQDTPLFLPARRVMQFVYVV